MDPKDRYRRESLKHLLKKFVGTEHLTLRTASYLVGILLLGWCIPEGISELWRKLFSLFTTNELYSVLLKLALSSIGLYLVFAWLNKEISLDPAPIEVEKKLSVHVKCLVVFLSTMPEPEVKVVLESPIEVKKTNAKGRFRSWEMPYLAVEYHLEKPMERLYVITSSGEKGTTKQFSDFKAFIKKAFPGNTFKVEEIKEGGINFEDIEGVFKVIEGFYRTAGQKRIREDDIIIDITGGQKTNSIAGALATLAIRKKFQYISTGDKEVYSYDVNYFGKD